MLLQGVMKLAFAGDQEPDVRGLPHDLGRRLEKCMQRLVRSKGRHGHHNHRVRADTEFLPDIPLRSGGGELAWDESATDCDYPVGIETVFDQDSIDGVGHCYDAVDRPAVFEGLPQSSGDVKINAP